MKTVSPWFVMNNSEEHIENALRLAHELILLADAGDDVREDIGCGILFGTIRDCAYKIQTLARQELQEHQKKRRKDVNSNTMVHQAQPRRQG